MEKQSFDVGFKVSLGNKKIYVCFDFGVGKFVDFVFKIDEPTENIKKVFADTYSAIRSSFNAKEVK